MSEIETQNNLEALEALTGKKKLKQPSLLEQPFSGDYRGINSSVLEVPSQELSPLQVALEEAAFEIEGALSQASETLSRLSPFLETQEGSSSYFDYLQREYKISNNDPTTATSEQNASSFIDLVPISTSQVQGFEASQLDSPEPQSALYGEITRFASEMEGALFALQNNIAPLAERFASQYSSGGWVNAWLEMQSAHAAWGKSWLDKIKTIGVDTFEQAMIDGITQAFLKNATLFEDLQKAVHAMRKLLSTLELFSALGKVRTLASFKDIQSQAVQYATDWFTKAAEQSFSSLLVGVINGIEKELLESLEFLIGDENPLSPLFSRYIVDPCLEEVESFLQTIFQKLSSANHYYSSAQELRGRLVDLTGDYQQKTRSIQVLQDTLARLESFLQNPTLSFERGINEAANDLRLSLLKKARERWLSNLEQKEARLYPEGAKKLAQILSEHRSDFSIDKESSSYLDFVNQQRRSLGLPPISDPYPSEAL
jgi:hypothetical protein